MVQSNAQRKRCLTALVAFASLSFTSCSKADVFKDSVGVFGKANSELTGAVDATLDGYRSRLRVDQLRGLASAHVIFNVPVDSSALGMDGFLCAPRVEYARIVANKTFIGSVATNLGDRVQDPAKELFPLIASLFSDYTIDIEVKLDQQALANKITTPCMDDIENFRTAAYGLGVSRAEAGVVAAALGLIEVLKDVIVPLIEAGLQEVDRTRRAAAVQKFLKKEKNRQAMEQAIGALDQFLGEQLSYDRHLAMFKFFESQYAFFGTATTADKLSECRAFTQLPEDKRSNELVAIKEEAFQICHRALWGKWKEQALKLVKSAAVYDMQADKVVGGAIKNLKQSVKRLGEVADGDLGPNEIDALISAMVRLVNLGKKIEEAASEENRKKVNKAIDDLFGAF